MTRLTLTLTLTLSLSGCADSSKPDPIDEVFTPNYRVDECPDATCEYTARFDADDMAACFGWDPIAYPGVGWPPDAPAELDLSWCNPELDLYCFLETIDVGETAEPNGSCDCVSEDRIDESCCTIDDQHPVGVIWQNQVSEEFLDQLSLNFLCGPLWTPDEGFLCELDSSPEYSQCPILGGFPVALNADYILTVDAADSYVDITCPLGSESFALSGGGSTATGPARFMTGLVWADDGNLGTHDLTDWHWSFDLPIFLDLSSGAFSADADDDAIFIGSGYDDLQGYTIQATIDEDASGNFYSNSWELDFEQTAASWTVEVHLEGDIESNP